MGLLAGQEGKNFILTGDISLNERPMMRGKPLSLMGGKFSVEKTGTKRQSQSMGINLKVVLLELQWRASSQICNITSRTQA